MPVCCFSENRQGRLLFFRQRCVRIYRNRGRKRGKAMHLRESGEMYLETILVLTREKNREVHSLDVAEYMNYSKPSVSRAVGLLKKGGYLEVSRGRCPDAYGGGQRNCRKNLRAAYPVDRLFYHAGGGQGDCRQRMPARSNTTSATSPLKPSRIMCGNTAAICESAQEQSRTGEKQWEVDIPNCPHFMIFWASIPTTGSMPTAFSAPTGKWGPRKANWYWIWPAAREN